MKKKRSPLTTALIAYAGAVSHSISMEEAATHQLKLDFNLSDAELNRLLILSSFGRVDEFVRDADPRYKK